MYKMVMLTNWIAQSRNNVLVGLLAAILSGCTAFSGASSQKSLLVQENEIPLTVIYLTRHAEKQKSSSKDPLLTEQGQQTALRLKTVLNNVNLDAVYSTPLNRTRETAKPTAQAQNIAITELHLPAHEMARQLLVNHKGKNVLVVGHSNTTPALIKQLGVKEEIIITEQDYGELFVVTLKGNNVLRFTRNKY